MLSELPQNVVLFSAGAFFVGWLLSAISSRMTNKFVARKRDPRDDRIRSLEADLRVARSDVEKLTATGEELEESFKETTVGLEKRDNVITHQQSRIDELKSNLKESVLKTRELRAELSERATENIKSELKIREVETELDIAQASTDLMATGVLDYSEGQDAEEGDDKAAGTAKVSKVAT